MTAALYVKHVRNKRGMMVWRADAKWHDDYGRLHRTRKAFIAKADAQMFARRLKEPETRRLLGKNATREAVNLESAKAEYLGTLAGHLSKLLPSSSFTNSPRKPRRTRKFSR